MVGLLIGAVFLLLGAPKARADRSPPGCTGSGLGISLYTSLPDVHIGDTISYSVNVFNEAFPACDAGETNPATAGAIRAYIVTPDGVTNKLVLRRTYLAPGEADFYTNVVSYVVRAQDMRPDGTVRATASDEGDIHQNITNSRGGGNQGVNTEVNLPCVLITAQCVGSVGENGEIQFTGTVTNCGNNTLVGVTVTNFANNGSFTVLFPTNLAIGQVASFSGSWVPSNPCLPSTITLVAQAVDQFTATPRTVTSSANTTCGNVLTPGIVVTKECPAQPAAPGQFLNFTGSVSNTGNVTLTNIVVVNDQPAPNTPVFTLASLAPGAAAVFSGRYLAPTNCSVTDTLTVRAASVCGVAVVNTVSATCPILTTPRLAVTALCPTSSILPGGVVTYTGTVRNTGDITLKDVAVYSDRPVAGTRVFSASTLAPGASAAYSGSFAVAANECAATTTVSASAKDICTSLAVADTNSITCPITTAPGIAVALACPAAPASAGGPMTFTGTVRNQGNVALNSVYLYIDQPVARTAIFGPVSLAVGAVTNFATTFVTPADVCALTGTVTVTGRDACSTAQVSQEASATCNLKTLPAIEVTQTCPAAPVIPGGLLTYSGTVKNSGDVTLTNVVVLNNLSGATPVFTAATMAPGSISSFTGSYTAPTNCSSTSVATATAKSVCGVTVSKTATTVCTILTSPQIAVTAACPTASIAPGGLVTYTGTILNTGNIALKNVAVISDRPVAGTKVFTKPALAPGESANYSGSYAMPAGDCSAATTLTASGHDICTDLVAANSTVITCAIATSPGITVALVCPVTPANVGGPMTYTGTVRNSGNVTLTNVFVVLSQPVPNTAVAGPLTLAPGAASAFVSTVNAPLDACDVSTTATATGGDNCSGKVVSNSSTVDCPLVTAPAIVITQACPPSPAIPGTPLNYSGTVRNTGNISLTNVVVLNNMSGNTPVFTASLLTPGTEAAFTGSYLAPTNCLSASTSTVTARSICNVAVNSSASSTCPVQTAPAIKVTQVCPANLVGQGAILTYSGTVSNAGNSTLTNVMVVNNWPIQNVLVFTVPSLAPGEVKSFTGSYQVPLNCCVAWSTVVATGQDCAGTTVTDTDSGTCQVLTQPRIVLTKTCPAEILRPGDLMVYSGTVSNAGNITLINVIVLNNQQPGSLLPGSVTLAAGESAPYTASYVVPPDFCGNDIVASSGLDACSLVVVASNVETTCPVLTTPRITVTQTCPPEQTAHGTPLVYTGTVANAGDVTLTNIYVVSNQPSNNSPVIGPISLAPGASASFSGSYLAPVFCCQMTDTLTASGMDRCQSRKVAATATSVCPLLYTPSLTVTPNCPAVAPVMGSQFVFSGWVTNSGDAILTNVLVFNLQGGQSLPLLGPLDLAPGEAKMYSGSFIVPSNICAIEVTATGQETCAGKSFRNVGICPVATAPLLAMTQDCPLTPVAPGGLLTYSGTVANAGNITLNNIVVTNDLSGNTPLLTLAALLPGQSAQFTGTYVVPKSAFTKSTSTATATSLCGAPVMNTAFSTCLIPPGTDIGSDVHPTSSYANGMATIFFKSESGVSYLVQYKDSLSDKVWTTLATKAGTGEILSFIDTSASAGMRFYRISIAP